MKYIIHCINFRHVIVTTVLFLLTSITALELYSYLSLPFTLYQTYSTNEPFTLVHYLC